MSSAMIVWTALPHGTSGDGSDRRFRLSVFVAPRLTTDGDEPALDAGGFPEFVAWTERVAAGERRFRVTFRAEQPDAPALVIGSFRPLAQEMRPDLWRALFAGVVVRSHRVEDLADCPQCTFQTKPAHDTLRSLYQDAAVDAVYPGMVVGRDDRAVADLHGLRHAGGRADGTSAEWRSPGGRRYRVLSPVEALRAAGSRAEARRAWRRSVSNGQPAAGPTLVSPLVPLDPPPESAAAPAGSTADAEPVIHLARLLAYHDQAVLATSARSARAPALAPAAPAEFHQVLASIGNYPELLRRLGLVFELELPIGASTSSVTKGWLRVEPVWDPPLTATPFSPWTAVDLTTLWPISSPDAASPMSAGFLRSGTTDAGRLDLVPIDLQGAALKLAADPSATGGRLPSLRGAGVAIVRGAQGAILHAAAERSQRNEAEVRNRASDLFLYAEDVNRGYRVDVRPRRGRRWHSLHELERSYRLADGGPEAAPTFQEGAAEGFVQIGATTVPAPGRPNVLLIEETLAQWRGWSLSAARPGKSVAPDGQPQVHPAATELRGLAIEQRVREGSLPRLRYGERYQFRVRTVDLAGNSPSLDGDDAGAGADPSPMLPSPAEEYAYRRFEPLDAPVLVPREEFREGESLERIVLRSGLDVPAEAYALQHPRYAHSPERHVVPPKTTQLVAELHGRFDASVGPTAEAKAQVAHTYNLGRRDRGSLEDPIDGSRRVVRRGSAEGDPGYTVHQEAILALPYLPDPLARGAVLRNLPGVRDDLWGDAAPTGALAYDIRTWLRGSVTRIAFGTDDTWPDFRPFRIQLVEVADFELPTWDAAARVLRIGLPPGEQCTVGLRSYLTAADLDRMGLWQWSEERIAEALPGFADEAPIRRRRTEAGDFWFLTPERRLTLIHAVQQPVLPPTLEVTPRRGAGQTFVELDNRITIHARSTAKVDLIATWTDTVDPVTAPPHAVELEAHVRAQEIAPPAGADDWPSDPTRMAWTRKDTLSLTAYGAAEGVGGGDPVSPTGAPINPPDPRSPAPHEFGDTKHRWVTYRAVATTRFRDCFPADVTRHPANVTQTSEPRRVNVLSSARPAAPSVFSALPAFKWNLPASPSLEQERHRWGGIRVYLDRPWYSSGEEERLAVVLWAGDPPWPPPASVRPYVSRWGNDPIWRSAGSGGSELTLPPHAEHFPMRATDPNGDGRRYVLPGLDEFGPSFAIAIHDLTFHDDGRCSCDIQIDAGSLYFPFARLALARFQPFSLEGLHLSPAVLTDLVQLAPHRSVLLTTTPDHTDRVIVTVAGEVVGQALDPDGAPLAGNVVEVAVEKRLPGTQDELGWVPAPLPAPIRADARANRVAGVLWRGEVMLPASRAPRQYRLVVREFELLAADGGTGYRQARRLVFADTVELP